ncbi:Pex12 amino terminal region-domain-containing protein [Hygrophoropsis aurantiaca]|uniref:Pex12 amino terminal region-domain-containing protein n=1 Tax=Hygrophoropsis aurantiaca TaxID=72124 RepID=A0ACB8AE58_9AGAM|nr:Pex12 amino terminal region-domain-containing protein [Hygrophoropsis aurantiaca]
MQSTWDAALASIRDSLRSHPGPDPRVIRVGQLDSELLDQELVQILQQPLNVALNKPRFEPELTLLIQLTLYKFSVWTSGATYGAKLQGLRYQLPTPQHQSRSIKTRLPRRLLLAHAALTILVPYIHTRLRAHALSNAWPDTPSSDRRRKAWSLLTRIEASHALLALAGFVAFLWDGRYRTITDRLLRMQLGPARSVVKREVSYEFMNRQMVWHAFTEFLLFLLPLISARGVKRRLTRFASRLTSLLRSSLSPPSTSPKGQPPLRRGKYASLPADQCAICAENASFNLTLSDASNMLSSSTSTFPPTNPALSSASQPPSHETPDDQSPPAFPLNTPYITSCGHTYCYTCIAGRMMDEADVIGIGWECLRCGEGVRSSDRWRGEERVDGEGGEGDGYDGYDGEGEGSDLGSRYEFSDFGTDVSGSVDMGSYTEMSE